MSDTGTTTTSSFMSTVAAFRFEEPAPVHAGRSSLARPALESPQGKSLVCGPGPGGPASAGQALPGPGAGARLTHRHPEAVRYVHWVFLAGAAGTTARVRHLEPASLAAAQAGHSQVLVLRGEAGIGKTALLEFLVDRAAGCRVARAAGVESEMELAYAGLHQLCGPYLDRAGRLPAPQRDALGTAFGLRSGAPPDRFLLGLAVLSLLCSRRRGGAADLRGGRRAVAGPGVGADARVRRPSTRCRTGGHGLRRTGDRGARG